MVSAGAGKSPEQVLLEGSQAQTTWEEFSRQSYLQDRKVSRSCLQALNLICLDASHKPDSMLRPWGHTFCELCTLVCVDYKLRRPV